MKFTQKIGMLKPKAQEVLQVGMYDLVSELIASAGQKEKETIKEIIDWYDENIILSSQSLREEFAEKFGVEGVV